MDTSFNVNTKFNSLYEPTFLPSEVLQEQEGPNASPAQSEARSTCSGVAKKIGEFILKILLFPLKPILWCVKRIFRALVGISFFSGFKMNEAEKVKRSEFLLQGTRKTKEGEIIQIAHKGEKIENSKGPLISSVSETPIDALYIKSGAEKKTGNVIVYVLGKDYQGFHPRNFDHLLDDGADVVLFNPSKYTTKTMSADLKSILAELRERKPDQQILLHGYCIGSHVAAGTATDLAEQEGLMLPTVVDRGYGDGFKIAKRICSLAHIPYLKNYGNKHFNLFCQDRIENHKAPMLFLSPTDGDDQMMHKKLGGKKYKNYTKVLYDNHKNANDRFIELKNADHWTPWTYEVHNEVKEFLKDHKIVRSDYKKFDEQNTGGLPEKTTVPWMRKHIAPLFLQ